MARSWSEIAAEKRAIRDEKLARSYGEQATVDPRIIASTDIQDLIKLLETREITTEAIILAHITK
jgi:hypothetical protein